MPQELKLPTHWYDLNTHGKMAYLCNSYQARDFTHAGRLLNERKKQLAERNEQIKIEQIASARLPYAD